MEKKDIQKRQVSFKVWIKDLVCGNYVKQEGWEPNYIETDDGRKISRVNLMGVVISKDDSDLNYHDITLDDGSGSVSLRTFEERDIFSDIEIGDILMIIGRPRKYGELIYIVPETIKKIKNPKWIELRKLELKKQDLEKPKTEEEVVARDVSASEEKSSISEEKEVVEENYSEKIYMLVKELDSGSGVNIEELIEKSKIKNCEKIINILLEEGDIFEIKPGKVKVLE